MPRSYIRERALSVCIIAQMAAAGFFVLELPDVPLMESDHIKAAVWRGESVGTADWPDGYAVTLEKDRLHSVLKLPDGRSFRIGPSPEHIDCPPCPDCETIPTS